MGTHVPLGKLLQLEAHKFLQLLMAAPHELREQRLVEGPGGMVSMSDLLAYQIGWGTLLLGWYKAGIAHKIPEMPGEGFVRWDYTGLARHFYQKYDSHSFEQKIALFRNIVEELLTIIAQEETRGRLDAIGVWSWCTLKSGKKWPLSKWIQVNTIAPYRRASRLVKKICLNQSLSAESTI